MSSGGGAIGISSISNNLAKSTIESIERDQKSSLEEPEISVEKGELLVTSNRLDTQEEIAHLLSNEDPFPEDADAEIEAQQFTFRAVLVGCILGGVIAASNVYLGLKTGWTFGAPLFGSIFGYAILKPLSKALPTYLGGSYFGPKENVCVQSAATAAGSLGLLFTSGFPAAYQLGLPSPKDDIGKLFTFTLCCAYYGMFFAIPLRKFYILKQKLPRPSRLELLQ